jgi:SAM-dependent methyltransferase
MPETEEAILSAVRALFERIATAPAEHRRTAIGRASALDLGYDRQALDDLPAGATESFAGVGNPLSLGEVRAGETVLDLGCGAGLDSILAARRVGPAGRVIGVDMTAAMVEKARRNARDAGVTNVCFHQTRIEELPLDDGTADVAMCNGMFNLCPDKPRALAECFRVLRPGGRLLVADAFLEDHVTPEEVARKGGWSE